MRATESKLEFEKPSFDEVISRLEGVKGRPNQKLALCPSHSDSSASLSIKQGKDGEAIIHCHAGCDYSDILRSLGLWEEAPIKQTPITKSKIVATYPYTDEAGTLQYEVVRLEPKSFRQRRPDGKDGWVYNLDGVVRVLYNLTDLVKPSQEPILLVEGEKDCENLKAIGAIATTNSGGAAKWEKSFNKYFKGRDVIILPDNDVPGMEHAEIVSKEIYRSASSVKIVELPVEAKGDVSDYLEEGNTLDDLLYFAREVDPLVYTEEDLAVNPAESHNLLAEMAVVGAVLKNPILIGRIIDSNLVEHVFDKKMRTIISAMLECSGDVDYITVGDKIGKGNLERMGGYDFLRSLENDLPEIFDIGPWINIIIGKSKYRELIGLGKELTKGAEFESQSANSLADDILGKIYDITVVDKKSGLTRIGDDLEEVIITAKDAIGKGITGIRTGMPDLDYIMSGLNDTDLIILAGRPGSGKTSLAMNMAAHCSIREGKNVAVFSLEMGKEQLISRMLCSEALVDSFKFKNGLMEEKDWASIAGVLPRIDGAGLFIDDTPAITTTEMRNKALRMQQEFGLDLIVVDYIQLMRGNTRGTRQEEVGGITRDLKVIAKELKVPMVALAQVKRTLAVDPRPTLSDLRESGELEQSADVVGFIHRQEYYEPNNEEVKGLAEIHIAKQRNGPVGTINVSFLKEYTRFFGLLEA